MLPNISFPNIQWLNVSHPVLLCNKPFLTIPITRPSSPTCSSVSHFPNRPCSIYTGPFPLIGTAKLSTLLSPYSFLAFVLPGNYWLYILLHDALALGNSLSVLSAIKLQNGFTAVVPGVQWFTILSFIVLIVIDF